MSEATILDVRDLKRHYQIGGGMLRHAKTLKAVDGVSFTLSAGKTLAVVGESGCGKSTLARMITMIEKPTAGSLKIDNVEVTTADDEAMRKLRPKYQEGGQSQWELLISASSVAQQVSALELSDAQSLFAMTLTVTVAEQDYLIESVASNEAFGQVYLYRLLLRETGQKCI